MVFSDNIVRTENDTKIMKIADKEGETRTKRRLQKRREEKANAAAGDEE